MFGHWRSATFKALEDVPKSSPPLRSSIISRASQTLSSHVADLVAAMAVPGAHSPPLPPNLTTSIVPLVEAAFDFNRKLKSESILKEYRVCGIHEHRNSPPAKSSTRNTPPPPKDESALFGISLGLRVSEAKGDGNVPVEEWVNVLETGPQPEFYL